MYRSLAALCLALTACNQPPPPPGSGALETTPTGSAALAPAPALLSMPQALTYPNGSVLGTDPKACRVGLLRDGSIRWSRDLPGCGGLLEATVAMDSVLYVRDRATLSSFDPEGAARFTTKLTEPPPPGALAVPTALADSRVAIAATTKRMDVYERDGKVAWSFSPPSGEVLVAAPAGMKTEGVILMTSLATYYLSAAGDVRWRVAGVQPTAQP